MVMFLHGLGWHDLTTSRTGTAVFSTDWGGNIFHAILNYFDPCVSPEPSELPENPNRIQIDPEIF